MEANNKYGLDNNGQIVVKNRAWRRKNRNAAQLDGRSRNFYTTSQFKKRRKNGKTTKVRKKSNK